MQIIKFFEMRNNRNILECKFYAHGMSMIPDHRNNRNILECKLIREGIKTQKMARNNRNILECKSACVNTIRELKDWK